MKGKKGKRERRGRQEERKKVREAGKKEERGKKRKKKGSTFYPFLPMFIVPLFTDLHLPVRTAKKTKQTKKKPDHL